MNTQDFDKMNLQQLKNKSNEVRNKYIQLIDSGRIDQELMEQWEYIQDKIKEMDK